MEKAKAWVLVIRHPDFENNYTTYGICDVEILMLDYGADFTGSPHDEKTARGWMGSVLGRLSMEMPKALIIDVISNALACMKDFEEIAEAMVLESDVALTWAEHTAFAQTEEE